MKKLSLLVLALLTFTFCGCSNNDDDDEKQSFILNLPNYEVETLYLGNIQNPDSKEEDEYGNPSIKNILSDNTKIFEFDCHSICYAPGTEFGFNSDSFAFTNCTSGNYSAVTKKGVSSKTYVIVGSAGYNKNVAIRFKDNNNSKEADDYDVKGLFITNSLFTYNSMKSGAGYYGKDEIFGEKDYLKLTISNLEETRSVETYLAQGTNLLQDWKWVDLKLLGSTKGLKFKLESTKKNDYGPLTPTYFCLDGIILED